MKLKPRHKGLARLIPLPLWGGVGGPLVFIVISIVLFSLSALHPGSLQGMRTQTADLAAPLLAAVSKPLHDAAAYVRSVSGLADLQAENERLRQENARLKQWYQTALQLQTENAALQDLLNVTLPPHHNFITARVIADSGNAFARSLLVLAGAHDGVSAGQAVLSDRGLIGRVVESGGKTARVLLLDDINSRIPVMVEGTNQRAVLAGANDGLPALLYLPPDIAIEEGARVLTSGHGGLLPFGLPVGAVVQDDNGRLLVRPYAEINQVHIVRIVERGGDPHLRRGSGDVMP